MDPETIILPTDKDSRAQVPFSCSFWSFQPEDKGKNKHRVYQQDHSSILSKLPGVTWLVLIRNLNLLEFLHNPSFSETSLGMMGMLLCNFPGERGTFMKGG